MWHPPQSQQTRSPRQKEGRRAPSFRGAALTADRAPLAYIDGWHSPVALRAAAPVCQALSARNRFAEMQFENRYSLDGRTNCWLSLRDDPSNRPVTPSLDEDGRFVGTSSWPRGLASRSVGKRRQCASVFVDSQLHCLGSVFRAGCRYLLITTTITLSGDLKHVVVASER